MVEFRGWFDQKSASIKQFNQVESTVEIFFKLPKVLNKVITLLPHKPAEQINNKAHKIIIDDSM